MHSVDTRVDSVHSVSIAISKPFHRPRNFIILKGKRAKYCQKSWFDAFELLHHDTIKMPSFVTPVYNQGRSERKSLHWGICK